MQEIRRLRVLGVPVDAVDMEAALGFVDARIEGAGNGKCILAVNPEKTFAVKRDRALAQFFEQAGLLIPDGIGVVLAARLLYGVRLRRLAGADLMEGLKPVPPRTDSDDDGMPDEWETAHGLGPTHDDSRRLMRSGYTAIEEFVNELAESLIGA